MRIPRVSRTATAQQRRIQSSKRLAGFYPPRALDVVSIRVSQCRSLGACPLIVVAYGVSCLFSYLWRKKKQELLKKEANAPKESK